MIKRFYYSLLSLKYTYFMFGLPLVIFALAFINTRRTLAWVRPVMVVCTIILGIVLVMYYREKFMIRHTLKNIQNIHAYESGGVVDCSFILEDRMLVCEALHIEEIKTTDIHEIQMEELRFGKYRVIVMNDEGTHTLSTRDLDEAQRFAAFIVRKNPNVKCTNITPSGDGSLKKLGA